ncbi:MAG: translation initiation factor IF-3 [Bacteroidales bacterium]|nr:translation initiation factor IF-3 [Bacteroidales bacterium]
MRYNPRDSRDLHRINDRIRVPEVRVVGDDVVVGIYPTREALQMARDLGLDLVEISPTAKPPVCRITDYQKFLYQQKKKLKEQKAKTIKVVVKEIRFGPQTDDHDYDFKLKHAKGFLEDGSKVKAYVFFKGRSIIFKDQGEVLLLRFARDLADYAKVEQLPQLEGKRMIIMLSPKKAPTAKKNNQKKVAPVVERKSPVDPTEDTVETTIDPSVENNTNPSTENDTNTAAE